MASVGFDGRQHTLSDGETVLDALLRNGHSMAHSCKAGSCGSCMMRVVTGDIPARAQAGLKDSWKARGYFLPCVCHPDGHLDISPVDGDTLIAAAITALDPLSADVLRVRLQTESAFEFRAGQYLTLRLNSGLARSYSIASLPSHGEIELHVRLLPGGRMSGWLRQQARAGDRVCLLGPSGDCFYAPGRPDQPLLLVGTGTGLAPLYGIVRDAVAQDHRGPIHLFHGALRAEGLYLRDELERLAAAHRNVAYTPTVFDIDGGVDRVVLTRYPALAGWRGFVCGDPALVQALRKKLFLAGMASRDIHADAFLPSAA